MLRSKKIRIYPTQQNKDAFRRWLGASRFAFNATVEYLRGIEGTRPSWMDVCKTIKVALPDWVDACPYQVVRMAIRQACDEATACKVRSKRTGVFHRLGFRSRKNPVQYCFIPSTAAKAEGIYYTISGGGMRYSETLPREHRDCTLKLDNGRWFLCVPTISPLKQAENQGRVVALDPGVRTFLSCYSESSYDELGKGDFSEICRLLRTCDRLQSNASVELNRQRRKRIRRAGSRLRTRVRNLVDELHHKCARYLVDHYDVILLPTFETQQMAARIRRKIRSKTVRSLLTWAHFRFKSFLKHKAEEFGKLVLDVCEAYTSKTCSWSGELVNIGGRKQIRGKDGIKMDRDANGARGILLRALVDTPMMNHARPGSAS